MELACGLLVGPMPRNFDSMKSLKVRQRKICAQSIEIPIECLTNHHYSNLPTLGWGGEDGDFYDRVKEQRKIIRYREPGLVHTWHPKMCTPGVTVFTETQINECNWSRDGEKGSDLARKLVDKWFTQHQPDPVIGKPIWQA